MPSTQQNGPDSGGHVYVRTLSVILRVADALGGDRESIAQATGVDLALLSAPDAAVPVALYYRMIDALESQLDNPDIGLFVGRINYLENMHLAIYMASSGQTLRDWLNMMPSIARLFGDLGIVRVHGERDRFALEWHPKISPNPRRCLVTDGFLAATVLQMGSYCLLPVQPTRVDITYPQPTDLSYMRTLLGNDLHFNRPVTSIAYPRDALAYPLAHVSTRLYESVADEFAQIFSEDGTSNDAFSLALHPAILRQLPIGECSVDMVAKEMKISRRTLQRRLKERGSSFKEILQDVKVNLAKKYLRDDRLSIMQIAFLLGYSDHSTFSAAFKSWVGSTPTEFRQR